MSAGRGPSFSPSTYSLLALVALGSVASAAVLPQPTSSFVQAFDVVNATSIATVVPMSPTSSTSTSSATFTPSATPSFTTDGNSNPFSTTKGKILTSIVIAVICFIAGAFIWSNRDFILPYWLLNMPDEWRRRRRQRRQQPSPPTPPGPSLSRLPEEEESAPSYRNAPSYTSYSLEPQPDPNPPPPYPGKDDEVV